MTYQELKALLRKHEERDPDTHLTACITFSSFEPENTKEYPWEARTYIVSSNNKAFQPNMGGYSIFGSCLNGTEPSASAAENGQTPPADDHTKPRYASVFYPVTAQGRRTANVCNAKPIAPRLIVPSLPSRKGEETHIESITKE